MLDALRKTVPVLPSVASSLIFAMALCACQCKERAEQPPSAPTFQSLQGAIIRGPTDHPQLALIFTGHEFAEGADRILDELARHHGAASFFLTGAFVTNTSFQPALQRMISEGHYVGPHSDRHLLYCEWDAQRTIRVTREEFESDLRDNVNKLVKHGVRPVAGARYFVPPFEHYNAEIAAWSASLGWTLINLTPGTRASADYTGEADTNFVSSVAIFESIARREREDPHGLNGFFLLLHLGSGPGRSDKFHEHFGNLLDLLAARGYQFVRVDALLASPAQKSDE